MDEATASTIRSALTGELTEVADELARLTERRDAIQSILDGLAKLFPTQALPDAAADHVGSSTEPSPRRPASYPRGMAAVLHVLDENPDRWFTATEVLDELISRGWPPDSDDPQAVVRVSMKRVLDRQRAERRMTDDREFVYRLARRSMNSEGPAEAGPSVSANGTTADTVAPRVEGGGRSDAADSDHHRHPASVVEAD